MTTLHTRDKRGRRVVILDCDVPDDPTTEASERLRELRERHTKRETK